MSSKLYDRIVLHSNNNTVPQVNTGSKVYKGFSTISDESSSFYLHDISLIKQDIINHFHIRKGERLENPAFGTLIWDVLFEPLTDPVKDLITSNVEEVINYDPRVISNEINVTSYDSGIQVECNLTFLPYAITDTLQVRFDQNNNLIS